MPLAPLAAKLAGLLNPLVFLYGNPLLWACVRAMLGKSHDKALIQRVLLSDLRCDRTEKVFSTEGEAFYRLNARWRATGFAGVGWAGDDAVFAGGVGIRYRIARQLGLDAGVDLAVGPEEAVLYLQFGRAWQRF